MLLFICIILIFAVMFYNDIMYHEYINNTQIIHEIDEIDMNELIKEYNRSRIDFHYKKYNQK